MSRGRGSEGWVLLSEKRGTFTSHLSLQLTSNPTFPSSRTQVISQTPLCGGMATWLNCSNETDSASHVTSKSFFPPLVVWNVAEPRSETGFENQMLTSESNREENLGPWVPAWRAMPRWDSVWAEISLCLVNEFGSMSLKAVNYYHILLIN